ncbi:MAG: DEAD/DEAH box helicase family protein [Spirochaetaceae bacterium]|jgi:type III restriction enzyme|nr:DEAD/DEAH box helicase family protein [Spirochaetaceae bacterium]
MELKNYQHDTLHVLRRFFERCRIMGHEEAFKNIASDPEIATRLTNLKNKYIAWDKIPHAPRVCLKVPTGGGKTIIAAYAVKIAGETWCEKEYPLVLWFVPSDTIRRQTVEALKNPRHPYRQTLDDQFAGKVQVFDLDEKFNIRPDDITGNTCIIVSTIQSFVKEDTNKYNVYRDNENLEDHFVKMPSSRFAGMEQCNPQDGLREEKDRPKYSFANLLYYHCPLMIVDEAHKVVTDLSQETLRRLNPSAVIEFTATPREKNNTLYNVYATELKEEEMIKLPIVLVEHSGWEPAVDEAITRRAELEKEAAKENNYIRPLVLFQAQSKDKEVTVGALKSYLVDTAGLPESHIRIATGDQKELDGIDIFNPNEPTRYIITVEALKEGWDCSFAYILCSLANVKSDTSVEQLLGRIMRMPYAKTRKSPMLNKAYAYVVSPYFGEAAAALTEKLINKGFDSGEARATIQQEQSRIPGLNQNWNTPIDQFKPETKLKPSDMPSTIQIDNSNTLRFTEETTDEDIEKVSKKINPAEAADLVWKYNIYKRTGAAPSLASQGIKFIVPRLMFKIQNEWLFATPEIIYENFDWNIIDYAASELSETEFSIGETGKGFYIDIDGSRLKYSYAGNEPFLPHLADTDVWTPANLVYWLDRKLQQPDISQLQMVEWLRRNIEYLTETRKITLANLMIAKYALLNKLLAKIIAARQQVKNKAFELFQSETHKTLDFKIGFLFTEKVYDGELYYQGSYKFTKHFLGSNKIPLIDGGETGEEFQCAKAIDAEPQVKFWLRNVARHPASFKLPTSSDFFYPDFVAMLNDNRMLVVEYKGAHLAETPDTREKVNIGEICTKISKGKVLFLLATLKKGGQTLEEQIKEKIRGYK